MIYSKSDIVLAFGTATTLAKRIKKFCTLWKKYCNGINGVTIPSQSFLIQITGFHESEDILKVTLINSEYVTHARQVWSSWDGGEPDLGDVLESSTVYDHEEVWKGTHIQIPTEWLLDQKDLEQTLIRLAKKKLAESEEAARQAEIVKLEEKLNQLKSRKV